MRRLVVAVVGLLTLMASGAQAVTLNVIGGQLHGASDVLVDGSLYDVEFLDGSCMGLYNGCDDVSDFTFQTEASARAASQALLDQVFLDGPSGDFDSAPALTSGCSDLSVCIAYTNWNLSPNGSLVSFVAALNSSVDDTVAVDFGPLLGRYPIGGDLTGLTGVGGPEATFARWSPIPEPSTALLLGLGLVGMAARRRV